jgi:hypothetical protein
MMNRNIYILFIFIFFVSCNTNDKFSPKCELQYIQNISQFETGKWRLQLLTNGYAPENILDHSCNEVIYDFTNEGVLKVYSDLEGDDDWMSGEFTYRYIGDTVFGNQLFETIVIRSFVHHIRWDEGVMTLNNISIPDTYFPSLVKMKINED